MPEKFKNKYRIKTERLKHWNYASNGGYFVTICVQNRLCVFGEILKDQMVLNELGEIVDHYWQQIPRYFDNTAIDTYIVMPNHVHGIIWINSKDENTILEGDAINGVSTVRGGIVPIDKNPMVNHSLSTVVRWYKGRTIFEINKLFGNKFQWQSRFYEHIIRNEEDLTRIRHYIKNNAT